MDQDKFQQAKRLADQSWHIIINQEALSDGTPVYIAKVCELLGCRAQGLTVVEAQHSIQAALADYLYALLVEGVAIPEPASPGGHTTLFLSYTVGTRGSTNG